MAAKEIIKLGADNTIDLLLKADGSAQSLSSVTHVALVFRVNSSDVTISSVGRSTWFDWTSGSTGVLSMTLGGVTNVTSDRTYRPELWVFDDNYPNGIYWGTFPVRVIG
jgi:hypothetical protein